MESNEAAEPVFKLTETSVVHTLVRAEIPGQDVLAMVYKDTPEGEWRGTIRFRYYRDDKVFDSKDEKSVYELTAPKDADPERLVQGMVQAVTQATVAVGQEPKVQVLPINGGVKELLATLKAQPWAHWQTEQVH